jgi:hypothetical protein
MEKTNEDLMLSLLMKKYSNQLKQLDSSANQNNDKLSQIITETLRRYGVGSLDGHIILSTISETLVDNRLSTFSIDHQDKKDVISFLEFITSETKRLEVLRTQIMFFMDMIDGERHKGFTLGNNNTVGINLSRRFDILQKYGFKCKYCGRKAGEVELELEHIIPKCRGGTDIESNLAPACRDCNRGKAGSILKEEVEYGELISW